MGAIIAALRPGDHENLKRLATARCTPLRDLAGILLEDAIRREMCPIPLFDQEVAGSPDQRPAA